MSGNLELVRSIFADWERGEFFKRAGWAHPDIECAMADGPSPSSANGLGGMASIFREFLSAYEGFRAEAQEYRETDRQRVLVLVQFSGRGKVSGLEIAHVQGKNACVLDFEGDLVRRLVLYWDRDLALADLGLEE